MFPFIDRLKAHNKKKHAENMARLKEIGNKFSKKNESVQNPINDPNSDPLQEQTKENLELTQEFEINSEKKSKNKILQSIDDSAKKVRESSERIKAKTALQKEKTAQRRADRPEILKAKRQEVQEQLRKIDAIPTWKRYLVNFIFMATAIGIAVLLISTDVWPASFISRLEFNQALSNKESWIRLETTLLVYVVLFPLQHFILKRLANKTKEEMPAEKKEDPLDF